MSKTSSKERQIENVIFFSSPIGSIRIVGTDEFISGVHFHDDILEISYGSSPLLKECKNQLQAYFDGKLKEFDLPLKFEGTEFQISVWQALQQIPYGETASYLQIAKKIDRPRAVRGVGGANHRNPISIIVPCHRVIGANGKLVGYGGGMWRKQWLLEHEMKYK